MRVLALSVLYLSIGRHFFSGHPYIGSTIILPDTLLYAAVVLSTAPPPTSALNATAQQTPMDTTRSAQCGGNGDRIAHHIAIVTCYTLLPSLLPWHHLRRMPNLISSSRLTSTSPPGAVAALLPSISPLPLSCVRVESTRPGRGSVAYRPTKRRAMVAEQGELGGRVALEDTMRCSHCSTSRDDAPGRTRFMIDLCV